MYPALQCRRLQREFPERRFMFGSGGVSAAPKPVARWGALVSSCNKLDGERSWIAMRDGMPAMFATRFAARLWIIETYGYLRTRPDLQREPHGWRMPQPVRLTVSLATPHINPPEAL